MSIRSAVLIVVLALTFTDAESAIAALAPRTETGPAQGVQATVAGTRVEIRFTGSSARWGKAHAGQRVVVSCASHRRLAWRSPRRPPRPRSWTALRRRTSRPTARRCARP